MDYEAVRTKVNEASRKSIRIVDMVTTLETGSLFNIPLTQAQIDELNTMLKTNADNLKAIAGEIKTLVS